MANETVYSLEIETGDIPKRLDEIRAQLEANAAQIKVYQDQTKAGNKLTNEQSRDLLRLRDTQKTLGREQTVLTQVTTAQTNSLDQQRKQLVAARLQWDRLSVEQRNNSKEGQALKQRIDSLNQSVSGAEESTGRFQRSVGNYANALKGAVAGSGALKGGIEGVSMAIKGNPMMLLATALTTVVGLFQKSQPVMDAVKVVMGGISAVVEVLTQRAGALFSSFSSLLTGDFAGAAKSAGEAFGGLGSSIAEAAKDGARFEEVMKQVEDAMAILDIRESETAIGLAALNKQFRDRTRTDKERLEIAKSIQSIEEANFRERSQWLQVENKAARARLDRLLKQAGVQNASLLSDKQALLLAQEHAIVDASWNKVKDTRIALNNREAESEAIIQAAQARSNLIAEQAAEKQAKSAENAQKAREKEKADKEKADNAKAAADAKQIELEQKRVEERAKLAKAELDTQLKETQNFFAEIERNRKEQLAKDLAAVAGNAEEEKKVRSQAELDLTEIKASNLISQQAILNDFATKVEGVDAMIAQNSIDQAKLASDEKIRLYTQEYNEKKAIADKTAKMEEANAQRTQQAFIQASQQIGQQLEQSLANYKGDIQGFTATVAAGILKTTLQVIKNQLIASQVAAVAQVTGQAVVNPVALLALAGRIALISAAFGAASLGIDKLFQVDAPKFEQGGLITGPRHSQGGVLIEAEGGEMVANRGAVASFGPQIEMMNAIGRGAAALPPMIGAGDSYGAMLAAMQSIQPEVSVKEIQSVSSRVAIRENNRSW